MTPQQRQARLLALMDARGLTPAQVADLMDRSVQTIYNWRAGTPHIPALHLSALEARLQQRSRGRASA